MSIDVVKSRKKRKAVRQEGIVDALRERIIAGEFVPGSRFPSRLVLQCEFEASSITVQRALDTLIADGFLFTRGHAGTFVAHTPPHLHSYGILFDDHYLAKPNDGTFWSQLAYHCLALQQAGDTRLNLYFNLTWHTDEPDYQRALADLDAHRLAGIIFAATFTPLSTTPLVTAPGLPRVAIFGDTGTGIPHIDAPLTLFFEKAVAYLSHRRRRYIALLGAKTLDVRDYLTPIIDRYGMLSHRLWQLPVHVRQSAATMESVRIATTLMMGYGDCRPDAIVVFDDVLVDYVVAGLLDAGLRIGEDIDVVAHCNYPLIKTDHWPIKRLGYSTPEILQAALALLAQQQQGSAPPLRTVMTPMFPEELAGVLPRQDLIIA